MRKWLLFLSLAFIVSCSSVDCPVKNVVATYYNIYDSDGDPLVLLDTLTIISKTKEGKDTILLNRGIEISTFSLLIANPAQRMNFISTSTTNLVMMKRIQCGFRKKTFPISSLSSVKQNSSIN